MKQAARQHGDADVWCLVARLVEGHRSRLHRLEGETARLVRAGAAEAGKVRVEQQLALIERVVVAAVTVRLPDLDHRVRDGHTVAVEHASLDADALARRRRTD